MRFNPKARLDTSRVRDRGRGTGGGRSGGLGGGMPIPGGVAGGGGLVGVIVVVLFLVLTQCLGDGGGLPSGGSLDGGRMGDTDRYKSCESGADANKSADCARVAVENSLYDFWGDELGSRFRAEKEVDTFTGGTSTGCGQASSAVGPFYCPVDETIYLDTTFFDDVLERQLGGPDGGFVEPYVLAHEYGHHIQNVLGTMGKVKTQQGPTSDSVRLELQADCYAGMWAKAATTTEDASGEVVFASLTDQDIQQAIEAATAVGDDRIQERSGGRVNPEQWTHGSAQQRVDWFTTGYRTGDLDACDTFAAGAL
ncbi:KPN_02809 family neutral zinc metallopeptidase [Nocardioides sp.]|uniref:KPN_02809 family neutral zinc metallopeptidase n=1 Tax=Nocardioides sp. TaxID=35761 RepID=UPI002ED9DB0C